VLAQIQKHAINLGIIYVENKFAQKLQCGDTIDEYACVGARNERV